MLQIAPNKVANKVANKNGLWYNVYGSIWNVVKDLNIGAETETLEYKKTTGELKEGIRFVNLRSVMVMCVKYSLN